MDGSPKMNLKKLLPNDLNLSNKFNTNTKYMNLFNYIKAYEEEIPVSPTSEPGTGSTQHPTPQTSRVQL